MTLPLSVVLVVFGAILTWGVNAEPNGLNVTAVGVILMVVGLIGAVLSFLMWERLGWGRPAAYEDHDVVVRRSTTGYRQPRRRTTVVEDERSGPPGPP